MPEDLSLRAAFLSLPLCTPPSPIRPLTFPLPTHDTFPSPTNLLPHSALHLLFLHVSPLTRVPFTFPIKLTPLLTPPRPHHRNNINKHNHKTVSLIIRVQMDSRGGCCIARYVPGASHVSTMDKIMLRFRPIAPKPIAGPTASDASSSESSDALLKRRTTKRKYVIDNNCTGKRRTRRRKTTSSPEQKLKEKEKQKQKQSAVTLPLLPETPDRKDSPARDLSPPVVKEVRNNGNNYLNKNVPVWLSFENRSLTKAEPYGAMMGGWCSCVTVECVTDTWVEGEWLGSTDEERRVRLSRDTCPGFISDGFGRVTWTNEAYGEMMKGEGQGPVLLVMKEGAVVPYSSFTCRVRVVQYACGRERSSVTLPCDVWRMDSGGFAWRLDIKTALSLRFGY